MRIGAFLAAVFLGLFWTACAGTPAPGEAEGPGFEALMEKEWRLVELKKGSGRVFSRDALGAEFDGSYTLEFQDGMVFGRGAPNTYRAPYEQGQNQSLSIQAGAATLMAPLREPEGLAEWEYFGYLERVYRWNLNGGALELHAGTENGEEAVLVYASR
jgi:hypothetical protein